MIFKLQESADLLPEFSGKEVILETDSPDNVINLYHRAGNSGACVYCIVLNSVEYLVDIDLRVEWQDIPLVIIAEGIGPYIKLYNRLPGLHSLDVKIVLKNESPGTYRDIRVLSSLGIPSELIPSGSPDWDAFYSLLIYYLYARQPHSPIYPFYDIISSLKAGREHLYCTGLFENPYKFVHVTKDGKMALTEDYAGNHRYLSDESMDRLIKGDDLINDELLEWKLQRRYILADYNTCSTCTGWLACGGCFRDTAGDNAGCARAFTELVTAAEESRNRRRIKKTWQHSS